MLFAANLSNIYLIGTKLLGIKEWVEGLEKLTKTVFIGSLY